ncbi:hypothetical protein ACWDFL_38330 [Streptomyces bungoensis]
MRAMQRSPGLAPHAPQVAPGGGHRFGKLAVRFEATVCTAAINIWL